MDSCRLYGLEEGTFSESELEGLLENPMILSQTTSTSSLERSEESSELEHPARLRRSTLPKKAKKEPKGRSPTGKSWIFTVNNPTDAHRRLLNDLEVSYMILGEEVGAEGTPHIQGGVTFKRSYSRVALAKLLPCHWEKALAADFMNYCMKDGNYTIRDNRVQGKRNDLKEACSLLQREGLSSLKRKMPEIALKYPSGCRFLDLPEIAPRTLEPEVVWLWGTTGVGKTMRPIKLFGRENCYFKDGTKWWDNYRGQKCIVIDDFRGTIPYHELLKILDGYPYQGQVKNGYININSPFIYITSCSRPTKVYTADKINAEDSIKQLLRRCNYILRLQAGKEDEDSNAECLRDCTANGCAPTFNMVCATF